MPIHLTAADLVKITDAEFSGDLSTVFTGTHYDSREIEKDNLFVALPGEASDGHLFLDEAKKRGSSLFLVNASSDTKNFSEQDRLVKVSNTLTAYSELAHAWRKMLNYPIIAITGSMGKTTVRNMTKSILSQHSEGGAAIKSYNNHTGVPYTLCSFSKDASWGITEVGMNHAKEIDALTAIIEPDICVITTVAPVHIGNLGSLENIAKAKLEIVSHAKPGSPLIVPADNDALWHEMRAQNIREKFQILSFGYNPACDVWVDEIKNLGLAGISFNLHLGNETTRIEAPFVGGHNALNFAIAALTAKTTKPDLTMEQIAAGVTFKNEYMRFEPVTIGKYLVVNDAYNANVESIKSMLKVANVEMQNGKKVGLVLGDIRELGDEAEKYHLEVAEAVMKLKPEFCVAVGEFGRFVSEEISHGNVPTMAASFSDDMAIIDYILEHDFDILFIKGSRGVALERVSENLKKKVS